MGERSPGRSAGWGARWPPAGTVGPFLPQARQLRADLAAKAPDGVATQAARGGVFVEHGAPPVKAAPVQGFAVGADDWVLHLSRVVMGQQLADGPGLARSGGGQHIQGQPCARVARQDVVEPDADDVVHVGAAHGRQPFQGVLLLALGPMDQGVVQPGHRPVGGGGHAQAQGVGPHLGVGVFWAVRRTASRLALLGLGCPDVAGGFAVAVALRAAWVQSMAPRLRRAARRRRASALRVSGLSVAVGFGGVLRKFAARTGPRAANW